MAARELSQWGAREPRQERNRMEFTTRSSTARSLAVASGRYEASTTRRSPSTSRDPDPVHLAGLLLVTVARPAGCRPTLEDAIVTVTEVQLDRHRELEVLATKAGEHDVGGAVALRSGCSANADARP